MPMLLRESDMWTFIDSPPAFVEFVLLVSGALMALSHILRPQMWIEVFGALHAAGARGVVMRTFLFELWPAMLIVALHQVWQGPGIVVTIYGWLLAGKVIVSMLVPEVGLRSLAAAQRGPRAFYAAGTLLLAISAAAGLALVWR
jgi:hypothetical protein